MSVGSDPDGGYAVPSVLGAEIEKLERELSPFRQIARVIQVGTSAYKQLVNAGGISSGWVGETSSRPTTSTDQLKMISPPIGEIYANPAVTQQLLDDAYFDVESWLTSQIAEEFAVQEGDAFINGVGGLKPKGFLTGDISTDPDSTRLFGELQYMVTGVNGAFPAANPADKLIDLIQMLRPPYRQGAVFLMHTDTLTLIRKMKSGDGNYIWQPSLTAGAPSVLLGYPVIEDVNMPTPDTGSLSVAFGNFRRGYLITDRTGIRVLRDPFTNKPYVHFYTTKRTGGMLLNDQAIKLLKFGTS